MVSNRLWMHTVVSAISLTITPSNTIVLRTYNYQVQNKQIYSSKMYSTKNKNENYVNVIPEAVI